MPTLARASATIPFVIMRISMPPPASIARVGATSAIESPSGLPRRGTGSLRDEPVRTARRDADGFDAVADTDARLAAASGTERRPRDPALRPRDVHLEPAACAQPGHRSVRPR